MNGNNTEVAILGGGLLLVSGSGVRTAARREVGGIGLRRRRDAQPQLQGRLQWRYRPRGGDPRHLRSVGHLVPRMLEVFFAIHDPTTLNRQGNDIGTQYRSVILCQSPEQRATAEDVIDQLRRKDTFANPIVTEIAPAVPFYQGGGRITRATTASNPGQGYCQMVVSPKVAKARKAFASKLKG